MLKHIAIFFVSLFMLSNSYAEDLVVPKPELKMPTVSVTVILPQTIDADIIPFSSGLITAQFDEITLIDSGYGGDLMSVMTLIYAIQDAQKQGKVVNIAVKGRAVSGHAFLTCFASNLTIENGSSVTFHGGGSYELFFNYIPIRIHRLEFSEEASQEKILQTCVEKKVLTKQDVVDIENGYRVTYTNIDGQKIRTLDYDYSNDPLDVLRAISELAAYIGMAFCAIALAKRI